MRLYRTQRGITLIELVITLAIFTLLLTSVIPSFSGALSRNRVDTTTDLLIRTVHTARTAAIKRGTRVAVCLSDNDSNCNPGQPDRLLIFEDSDRSGSPSNPDDLIRSIGYEPNVLSIRYNRSLLVYSATGYASGTNGTFTVCESQGAGDFVIVSTLGRPRKGRDYDGDGIVEKTPGSPIDC